MFPVSASSFQERVLALAFSAPEGCEEDQRIRTPKCLRVLRARPVLAQSFALVREQKGRELRLPDFSHSHPLDSGADRVREVRVTKEALSPQYFVFPLPLGTSWNKSR